MTTRIIKRRYNSRVRDAHSVQTREFILMALSELLSTEGLEKFSVRKLSKHAGISVRTIYRHFPSKVALLDAISAWVESKITGATVGDENPRDSDELISRLKTKFQQYDKNPQLILAQIFSRSGRAVRQLETPSRMRMVETALEGSLINLDPRSKREIISLCYFLMSGNAWQHFRDVWKYDASVSANLCTWAIKIILNSARGGDLPQAEKISEFRRFKES